MKAQCNGIGGRVLAINGYLRIAFQVAGVIFVAGIFWAKLGAVQTTVGSIEARVARIESVMMTGRPSP